MEDLSSQEDEEEVILEETWSDRTVESSKAAEVLVLSRLKEEEAWVEWAALWEDLTLRCQVVALLIQP